VIQGGTSGEIFCDDFNSYTVGGQLVDQNPTDWTTWSNSPGSAEDPYIVDNGGNVVEITGTNDLVYVMPNYTNGYFEITFDLFVPTGGDAYFNTLQEFAGTASSWGMQVYFGETNPGEGNLDAGGALAQLFTFDYDTWMAVKVTVDLDNDWGEFYLDDVLIHGWQWSTGSFGTGDLNQLGGNNFYAWADGANGNPLYHFDNYCLNGETINLEPVTNVTATPDGTDVLVEWEAPDPGALTEIDDDFESYEDFTLDFAPWTNIDVDGSTTYGMTGIDWPNAYDAQAFIIFNPSMTTPAVTDIIPHSGDKLAACFASTTPDNDDWMITPKVLIESGDQLSFWVKSYTADYGLERYKVGVSTTGMDPADFTIVSGANYLEAPATDWEEYTYDMSSYAGQEVYVGIQCVSSDAFIFLVDDFSIGGSKSFAVNNNTAISGSASKDISANAVPGKPNTVFGGQKGVDALTGFNVYRNDGFVDFVSAPTTEYLDQGLSAGTYEYCVTAVYDEGESVEACADPVTIGSIFPAPPMNVEAMATIDGDIDVTWDVPGMEWIRWDAGVNNGNGVGLTSGGTFSVSSHWSPEDIAPYHGLSIETISFYANADPAATYTVKVWTGSNGLTEIYSQDVSTFTVDDWNDIALTTPVTIDANDHIWFGYECTHGAGTFPAGCDDGPALLGKGDMILSGGAWVDLVSLSATLDYNWNLGAYLVAADGSKTEMITKPVVAPASLEVAESGTTGVSNKFNPGSTKELTGYNVYHNLDGGTMELLDFVTTNSYTHTGAGMVVGLHCYDITAVYDPEGESEPAQGCEQIDNVAEFGNNMIQIFPNPASDVVNIKSDVTITSITVYNYAGQIV
ncbi:MAG: choice-of-anchor J domain-containing protein, partial [Bacteroidales bacterium]|nr:choice-of-anchor J domain-containing protein [Bacteroidales bacterium]